MVRSISRKGGRRTNTRKTNPLRKKSKPTQSKRNVGQPFQFGKLAFRSSGTRSYNNSPTRKPFYPINAINFNNARRRGEKVPRVKTSELYNNNNIDLNKGANFDNIYDDWYYGKPYKKHYGNPFHMNLVNREILMNTKIINLYLKDIMDRYLDKSDIIELKSIINGLLNKINTKDIMETSIKDIMESYLDTSGKNKMKSIINKILRNQKERVKMMYQQGMINKNNLNAIKPFINSNFNNY